MTKSQNQTAVKQYLSLNITGYEGVLIGLPEADRVKGLFEAFYSEYGFNIRRYGLQGAIREWLMGLPSVISIHYKNHEIVQLLIEWSLLDDKSTEAKIDKLLDQYWEMLAYGLIVLGNKYKVIK